MRYLIYLLVAVNCVYFGWQVLRDVPDAAVTPVQPPLPPGIRELVTLKERDARQSSEIHRQIEEVTQTRPPAAAKPKTCQALGPFLAESNLKVTEKRLDKLGLVTRPHTRYVREQVGYAVLLPEMEYSDAVRLKDKLAQENIAANFIDSGNVISLGAFKEKAQAEKIMKSAQAIGLDLHLEPSYANRSTYWLVFEGGDYRNAAVTELTRKNSGLRLEEMTCP